MQPASTSRSDQAEFQRILTRNLAAPLVAGVFSAALFVGIVLYLLNVLGWVEHTDRVIARANEATRLLIDEESGMRGYLLTGNEQFLEPYEVARPRIKGELDGLSRLVADNPPQVDRLGRIVALHDQWLLFARDVIAARRAGGNYQDPVANGGGKRLTDSIRDEFNEFINVERRLLQERDERANVNSKTLMAVYIFTTLLLTSLLAYFGRRQLTTLSERYGLAMRQQLEHGMHLRSQAWLRDGQAELAEQLAGHQDLHALGRNTLEFLARHLGAAVGAVYVAGDAGQLRRVAGYGFSREHAQGEQTVERSASLVSEVATGGRLLQLDTVPADYLRVASGLGHGVAKSVLIAPATHEGGVNAVVELGFLRPLEPRDAELLRQIAGALGASVEAARYRQKLQDVLEQTQQLNEELQVQQEELRTANEELEEQSRALRESQANLEGQQAELEQTNVHLSELAEKLSEQRDAVDAKNAALHAAQGELEARAEELSRASRYKSEFLANMSHELRTPLNSSLILARLLADNTQGNLNAEQVKFAESIYSAGNDLLDLINDILDIAKVEAGKLEIHAEAASVQRLAQSLGNTFEPLAARKSLNFFVDVAPDVPETLFTDRQRLEQVLKNLLSNALKFTDKGQVALRVTRHGDSELAFAVSDSGIGIEPAQQEAIFEAFRQADGTTSRRYGGTGLGLSISRDLAQLLGGSISVASEPGKGSTFTLRMPLDYKEPVAGAPAAATAASVVPPTPPIPVPRAQPVVAPPPAKAPPPPRPAPFADDRGLPADGRRLVLVVEDEPVFAGILFELAHELGYRCLVAQQSAEGWELATQHLPDAVLLDMRLPDASGLSVLQRLKESPATRHIPVHAISAEDMHETAMQMGAIGYAFKPASREQLQDVFARLEAKLTQKLKRVLLVEDDRRQQESVRALISGGDIEITAVDRGHDALELLRTTVFDCMIIDLKLPDMQGQELLKRMAAGETRSFPPVVVYTGRNLTRDEEAELLRYSRSIIIKGARSPERLLDEVTLFLHQVETQLSTERQKMLRVARSRDKLFEGRRILVVDDDVRNIFALTSALEHKGALVEVGRNGREALDKLARVPDIDLVLMDIMMPEMDGYTAMREIRKNPAWSKLPIIAVTAKAMKDDQERCLAAGANDYLAKPIELERLFSLMRVWMPKMERI